MVQDGATIIQIVDTGNDIGPQMQFFSEIPVNRA